jgi:hypothetical protein
MKRYGQVVRPPLSPGDRLILRLKNELRAGHPLTDAPPGEKVGQTEITLKETLAV